MKAYRVILLSNIINIDYTTTEVEFTAAAVYQL